MLILKTFTDDTIPVRNFEFQKKNILSLTKDFFSQSFHSCKLFHKRVSCAKMEPKGNSIQLSTFLKYGLTEMKKASS